MSPRTGRPKSENPKATQIAVRLDEDTLKKLDLVAERNSETRVQTIRNGIKRIYTAEVNKMAELTMKTKNQGTVIVNNTASAFVTRDVVTNEISAYFICMNDCNYEVSETVYNAVINKFNLMVD